MSNYNWERGTIKIPTKAWKPLRDRLVKEVNERRQKLYQRTLTVWECLSKRENIQAAREAVKVWNKGQPVKHRIKLKEITPRAIFGALNEADITYPFGLGEALKGLRCLSGIKIPAVRRHGGWGYETSRDYELEEDIAQMLFPYDREKQEHKRLAKPKKSDERVKPLVSTKVQSLDSDDGGLYFDHKAKTITWDVPENNRAVEAAGGQWLAQLLFPLLNRIEWTRGSGGTIVGNDEYNRDDRDYEGGGGNYTTREFGPKAKARRRFARH